MLVVMIYFGAGFGLGMACMHLFSRARAGGVSAGNAGITGGMLKTMLGGETPQTLRIKAECLNCGVYGEKEVPRGVIINEWVREAECKHCGVKGMIRRQD